MEQSRNPKSDYCCSTVLSKPLLLYLLQLLLPLHELDLQVAPFLMGLLVLLLSLENLVPLPLLQNLLELGLVLRSQAPAWNQSSVQSGMLWCWNGNWKVDVCLSQTLLAFCRAAATLPVVGRNGPSCCFAKREINCKISCVTVRHRDLNLVWHEFLHNKFCIKYVSLVAESFYFPLYGRLLTYLLLCWHLISKKGQKVTQTLLPVLENLIPCMKDASGSKSYLETRRQSYTTDWVCAAKSQIEHRDMLAKLVLRIIEQRCYIMTQTPPNYRTGRGRSEETRTGRGEVLRTLESRDELESAQRADGRLSQQTD